MPPALPDTPGGTVIVNSVIWPVGVVRPSFPPGGWVFWVTPPWRGAPAGGAPPEGGGWGGGRVVIGPGGVSGRRGGGPWSAAGVTHGWPGAPAVMAPGPPM